MKDQVAILVVEDDREVQNVIDDALSDAGFEPAITSSGEEALTLLRGNQARYRALVADISLRGRMSGWEVATRVREMDPQFPVLYLTGTYVDQWVLRGVPNSVLLTKPLAPSQLVSAVSQLLDESKLSE